MLRTALAVLAAFATLALSAPVAGAISLEDLAAQEQEGYAAGLVRVAMEMTGERHRACKVSHLTAPPSFTDDAPSARLLSLLSLLRRPPIAQDAISDDRTALLAIDAEGIHRNWYRMGRAADGVELHMVTARESRSARPVTPFCLRQRRAQLVRLLRDEDRRTGALALRAERRAAREQEAIRRDGSEHVFLFLRTRDRIAFGSWHVGIGELQRRGLLVPATFTADFPERTHVIGTFPDGVTSIDLVYPRQAFRGPLEPANVYESELRLTVPVQDNLVSFWVAREGADAANPSSATWRAADGSVVRVVRGQR